VEAAPLQPLPRVPGYAVEGVLGRGGFGLVLSARREDDGARAAVKIASAGSAEAASQLAREADALRRVGPPAAPALLGQGRLGDGTPFLAMERLDLPPLSDRLDRAGGPLENGEAVARALELAGALSGVHAAGLAHGDVKPENVLLAPGSARLLDFGLAVPLGGPAPGREPGAFAGTAEYMAPEQVAGDPPDARSDLYAAGAVLYEMLAGRPPFVGPAADVRQAHADRRPRPPSELAPIPPDLEAIVLRCLAKEPAGRFASAAELAEALRAVSILSAPASAWPAGAPAPPAVTPARRRVAVVFLESALDPVALGVAARSVGGEAARISGGQAALVFDAPGDENPLRSAARAAEALLARGAARRARLDLVQALVKRREGAPALYLAAELGAAGRHPAPGDPEGLSVSPEAAEALPGERIEPSPVREGLLLLLPPAATAREATAMHRAAAAPLLDRGPLLDELLALARGAFAGAPALAAVIGAPGLGKTRLAAALAEEIRRAQPAVQLLELRPRPLALAGEGTALEALLRWALELPGSGAPPSDGGRALLGAALPGEVGEGWPAVALALGWLPPDAPEVRRLAAAAGALRSLQARAAAEGLRRRARASPVCVVVDDAHAAEPAALDALELAALAEHGTALFACAVGRPALEAARPAFGERAARARRFDLAPLSTEGAAELCRWLLRPAEHVPAQAVAKLAGRSGGVPLLLVELVRALRAQGLLRRLPGGSWTLASEGLDRAVDVPLVDWLAARELSALPPDLAAHARLLALLGDETTPEEVAGLLSEIDRSGAGESFPLDAGAAGHRLSSLGILSGDADGPRFRSPLLREAVGRTVPPALEAAVHAAAFRFYRAAADGPPGRRLSRLARHAAACGQAGVAAGAYLRLAQDRAARHDYLAAEDLFTRALEQVPEDDRARRLPGLRGRGLVRYRIGRGPDAAGDLAAAAEVARGAGDETARAGCLLDLATALDWMNDFQGSARRVEEARAAAGAAPPPALAARLRLGEGRALFRAERRAEARLALGEAAALAEPLGDEGYETLVIALLLLVFLLPAFGLAGEADRAADRVLSLARARGDLLHQAAALNNRQSVHVARKDLAGALADLDAYRAIGRELGMASIEHYAAYNGGELLYQAGDLDRAAERARRARDLERAHPELAPFPYAELLEARILARRDDGAGARSRLAEIARMRERARAEGRGGDAAPSFEVLLALVDLSSRTAGPEEWDRLVERSRDASVEQEPIEVLEMRALAALRAGRAEEARRALAEARALAARIPTLMDGRLDELADRLTG
jgi:hypothetical protein